MAGTMRRWMRAGGPRTVGSPSTKGTSGTTSSRSDYLQVPFSLVGLTLVTAAFTVTQFHVTTRAVLGCTLPRSLACHITYISCG